MLPICDNLVNGKFAILYVAAYGLTNEPLFQKEKSDPYIWKVCLKKDMLMS